MNPLLARLHPYPFERLRALHRDIAPNPAYRPINLGIGEPQHPTPALIKQALIANLGGLASYPATAGEPALREAIAALDRSAATASRSTRRRRCCRSTARARRCSRSRRRSIDPTRPGADRRLPESVLSDLRRRGAARRRADRVRQQRPGAQLRRRLGRHRRTRSGRRTQLLYVCSPGNPTGAVMPLAEWQRLFELSDRHGFVIASDECYSEIYFRDEPPLGALEAAHAARPHDFRNLVVFTSLSKRSNVPGHALGLRRRRRAAAEALPALPHLPRQRDEPDGAAAPASRPGATRRTSSRTARCTARKFAQVTPLLADVLDVALPDAGFYLWARRCRAATTSRSPAACSLNTM